MRASEAVVEQPAPSGRVDPAVTEIAFKVDVCNHRALHVGLPGILRILDRVGVTASLFVAFGPDHSGRAIRRIFRRGFVKKMIRTRAPRMYGLRTLLNGTLLPAPLVGESGAEALRAADESGHAVGLHGYDHVSWQDHVGEMSADALRRSYAQAISLFERTLGRPPAFTGAPGWQVSPLSLLVQDEFGFAWASDCRGGEPFFPALAGRRSSTIQIPTTLPTSDELLGAGIAPLSGLSDWYDRHVVENRLNVVGLHAEAEGIHFASWLRDWLASLRDQGTQFVSLSDVAARERDVAPLRRIAPAEIPGRVGVVAGPEQVG